MMAIEGGFKKELGLTPEGQFSTYPQKLTKKKSSKKRKTTTPLKIYPKKENHRKISQEPP